MLSKNRLFKISLIVTLIIIYFCDSSHTTLFDRYDRYKRNDEFASITDKDHLAKQYSLVDTFGSLDVLGRLKQFPDGKVDTSDFGQNIHYGYKHKIRAGEKEAALNKIIHQTLIRFLDIIERQLEERA